MKTADENQMKKINPFLWFDSEAEEAAKFYVGIFKNSRIGKIARYPKEAAEKIGRPPGSVITVEFTLDRVDFVALNGGPQFKFTEAISFSVNCGTQDEIDYFWEKLSADGGSTGGCGWLKRQIRSLVAGQPGLSRRYVGRSRCREDESRHKSDDGNGQDRHRRLRKGRERMKDEE